MMKLPLKIGDILVYVFVLLLVGASFLGLAFMKADTSQRQVVVEVNGQEMEAFPLVPGMKPRQIRIDAGGGKYNILEIIPDGVNVKEANCPDQVCVRWGRIEDPGQVIVCLPHKVIVKIVGKKSEAEPPLDDIVS